MGTQITEINRQKTPKKQASKPKKIFFYWAVAVLLAFFALAIFVFQHIEKDNEPQKLRLQVLKNKCYMFGKISEEERQELCKLLAEIEGKIIVDCEKSPFILQKENIEHFFVTQNDCFNSIKSLLIEQGFDVEEQLSTNNKGLLIKVFKNKTPFFEIRLMHRSSDQKYKKGVDYFRLNFVNASFYTDINGIESQDGDKTHIHLTNCNQVLMTIQSFLNQPKIKNAHKRKN